jgi:DNA repair and recombination RAD54-like protein
MHPLQRTLYDHFLKSKAVSALLAGKQTGVLSSITALRKLINHPKLVADVIRARQAAGAVIPSERHGRAQAR